MLVASVKLVELGVKNKFASVHDANNCVIIKTADGNELIYYPPLINHPNHSRQASGGGGVMCVRTANASIAEEIVKI